MKPIDLGGEIKIAGIPEFDLRNTFECGQCFRWSADEHGIYTGVAYGRAVTLRRDSNDIIISGTVNDFNNIWREYFDLDRDYAQIRQQLSLSVFMEKAAAYGAGIRILRQEPWEALCTFIISQNNNIPRIKKLVSAICSRFGESIEFNGEILYSFPHAERLAAVSEYDLYDLRLGYRAKYVAAAARAVASGALDLGAVAALPPNLAREELKKLPGVGDKVADCVMLYGLHMIDTFPVDLWIKRALTQHCGPDFDPSCFSPNKGIAQQYIYHYIRNSPPAP